MKIYEIAENLRDTKNTIIIIYGHPMTVEKLVDNIEWKYRVGDDIGGDKIEYSFGINLELEVPVYVVTSQKMKQDDVRIAVCPKDEPIRYSIGGK